MRKKLPPEIRFEEESNSELERLRSLVGQQVPISLRYALGARATLVCIEDDLATLVFPNGARIENVPIRDLVDDSSYWKR